MRIAKRVLIVDDDEDFRHMLCMRMALHEEFVPVTADSGTAALRKVEAEAFDLIILDVGLPDIDGRETCRTIRRHGITTPVIMLTGASTDADTILGLDAGADDYIAKPFRMDVLIARMRAHLR